MQFAWNYHKMIAIGATGCGKTKLIIDKYLPLADRLMIIDTNNEISTMTGLKKTRNIMEWSPATP